MPDFLDQQIRPDYERKNRTGVGEVIFGQGKSVEQICTALAGLVHLHPVLVTRVDPTSGPALLEVYPEGCWVPEARLFSVGKALHFPISHDSNVLAKVDVAVVSAGTTDLFVAWEALGSALFMDLSSCLVADVGVAGLHRLMTHLPLLERARVLIAVAGMEGALPSVLAGLVRAPVIAVPTSIGYGAHFSGLAPLLAMLTACAPGIGVVNIDNGFGAAALAFKILRA